MPKPRSIAAAACTVLVAACSAAAPSSQLPVAPAPHPVVIGPPPSAQPDTVPAARSVAAQFLAMYSAGQWDAAWQFLAPADKAKVPEALYAAFHGGCPSESAGMAYEIQSTALAGTTAVVAYAIPVLASFGAGTLAMQWATAGWGVELSDASGAEYGHGSLKADLAAARADGKCLE